MWHMLKNVQWKALIGACLLLCLLGAVLTLFSAVFLYSNEVISCLASNHLGDKIFTVRWPFVVMASV